MADSSTLLQTSQKRFMRTACALYLGLACNISYAAPKNSKPKAKPQETTKIAPEVTYRQLAMQNRESSVLFSKKKYKGYGDQLYLTLLFAKEYDYKHNVVIEPSIRTPKNSPESKQPEVVMEQAYVQCAISSYLTFTAGKKTEYDGSGYLVNPSDLLNEEKDIFDPLYQKEGKFFTRLRLQVGETSVGAGFIPKRADAADQGKLWMQASTSLLDIDLRTQYTQQEDDKATFGASAARFFGDRFELHADGRYQTRQHSFEEELKYSSYKPTDPSAFYVAGTRFVISNKRSFVVETIQKQAGLLTADFKRYVEEDISKRTEPSDPPTRLIGRHYVFATYQDDDTIESIHLGLTGLLNYDDHSRLASFNVKYLFSPLTAFEVIHTDYAGKPFSEFGERPFYSLTSFGVHGKF